MGIRAHDHSVEPVPLISADDVFAAAARIEGVANRTPVFTSRTLDERAGASVHLKAESFQRGGAFKFRGAYNKIASLTPDVRGRGVLAYSSGNHAQAVAIAARLLDTTATIVMPEDTPPAKLDATRGYGAEIVSYDRWNDDRDAIGRRLAEERGVELVRPYDDPLVMAGQGTAALELLEDVPELDTARRAGRWRRAHLRLCNRRQGAASRASASWVWSLMRATTRAARSPPASVFASTSRARSPTVSARPSPVS